MEAEGMRTGGHRAGATPSDRRANRPPPHAPVRDTRGPAGEVGRRAHLDVRQQPTVPPSNTRPDGPSSCAGTSVPRGGGTGMRTRKYVAEAALAVLVLAQATASPAGAQALSQL